MCFVSVFLAWPFRRWVVAFASALGTFLLLGLTTAVISNPVFGREIAPTPWAMDVLVLTSTLSGLLVATYVRTPAVPTETDERPVREGIIGGALTYFAIGCPVCNKLVLVALGATGAVQLFAPIQPYLAAAGLLVLTWALYVRLRGEARCAWRPPVESDSESDQSESVMQ